MLIDTCGSGMLSSLMITQSTHKTDDSNIKKKLFYLISSLILIIIKLKAKFKKCLISTMLDSKAKIKKMLASMPSFQKQSKIGIL